MNKIHHRLSIRCGEQLDELNEWGNHEVCEATVTYEDHFAGLVQHRGWDGDALRLRCPECGAVHDVCPVCHGDGWFLGETTGEQLACHVCNQQEYMAQERGRF